MDLFMPSSIPGARCSVAEDDIQKIQMPNCAGLNSTGRSTALPVRPLAGDRGGQTLCAILMIRRRSTSRYFPSAFR
jgi:hypothetical protein